MRLHLVLLALALGCGGGDDPDGGDTSGGSGFDTPDWSFNIEVSALAERCAEVEALLGWRMEVDSYICGPAEARCENLEWDWEDPGTMKQTMQYDVFFEDESVRLESDGEPFGVGILQGCEISYQTPTWLEEKPDGAVTWELESVYAEAGGAGVCPIAGDYDWLGIEEITVVESENLRYPKGCTYRVAVTGEAIPVEE